MSKIYREKWYEHLGTNIKYLKDKANDYEAISKIAKTHFLVCSLALEEIEENEPLEKRALEFANTGLDLSGDFMTCLMEIACKIDKTKTLNLIEFIRSVMTMSKEEKVRLLDENI